MRHIFVSDLVKELLGPRHGATETLPLAEEPRNEYSTGQLIPPQSSLPRTPEEDDPLAPSPEGADDDTDDAPGFVNQSFIDAGQTFRRIPSSMGISFVLAQKPHAAGVAICVTWARYEQADSQTWRRKPHLWITELKNGNADYTDTSPDKSLQLTCVSSTLDGGRCKISVYLCSALAAVGDRRSTNEEVIFQPELRIALADETLLSELGDLGFASHDEEWNLSTRQYDHLPVYARGHLCGAYWRDIDPQRPEPGVAPSSEPPFQWIDGIYFSEREPEVKRFFAPTLRTDFIPLYPGPTPSLQTTSLDLRASNIANFRSVSELSSLLTALADEYESWISRASQEAQDDALDVTILSRHREAIRRIRDGILFVNDDRQAFLSFLFMQQVMARQYAWGKQPHKREMSWRPFQLAFILMCLESTAKDTPEREICDTIWFPTGGGKTEAYLGLAAFALAYRRRVSQSDADGSKSGEGTTVISRYTLRLLTIQQFRRALRMVMACEILRCTGADGKSAGWLPEGTPRESGFAWGRTPFSIGLWVGSRVTPNAMKGEAFRNFAAGALPLLSKPAQSDDSDPAQILECPCCGSVLSFPFEGIAAGQRDLRLHIHGRPRITPETEREASTTKIVVMATSYVSHVSGRTGFLTVSVNLLSELTANDIHKWWQDTAEAAFGVRLNSFTAARPGYVALEGGRQGKVNDYEIRCPSADCELNQLDFAHKLPTRSGQWMPAPVHPSFALANNPTVSRGVVISALTVDERLYRFPPSLLIATVDKIARLAFTNEAASLFGRVRSFDSGVNGGFSQEAVTATSRGKYPVSSFAPPQLIIQDELHLLDGPIGSTFGLFELSIEHLSQRPKYVASSATIRNSQEQIACLIGRKSFVFPPAGTNVSTGFFLQLSETHPLDEARPGRLFLGLAFPGRAPQTPTLRTWGRLLQTAEDQRGVANSLPENARSDRTKDLDYFWTLVGYFNAVRELAQAETLVRQDIPQFLDKLQSQRPGTVKRENLLAGFRNLSSQTGSSELPGILAKLDRTLHDGDPLNAVAATSMFGTGVDVARLSLMVMHGQPKSASQYIQAVGRVGRERAGLAVVLFRVAKPRDLNHYEYFTGYHRRLAVSVEPLTVKPLSPRALDRIVGPLLAILIRNWNGKGPRAQLPDGIDLEPGAGLVENLSQDLVADLLAVFARKWDQQPPFRRPGGSRDRFILDIKAQIDKWQEYARRQRALGAPLQYTKGSVVVLGQSEGTPSVFPNVPQSLREVEPTVSIYSERD